MEEKWTISEAEKSLLGISFDWIQQKIVGGEGFSVLLVSDHPSGRKMSKYTMESVEAALVQCKAELRSDLNDATAYALAYDVWFQPKGGAPRPMFMLQCERRDGGTAMKIGQLYKIKKGFLSSKRSIQLDGEMQLVGPEPAWLE